MEKSQEKVWNFFLQMLWEPCERLISGSVGPRLYYDYVIKVSMRNAVLLLQQEPTGPWTQIFSGFDSSILLTDEGVKKTPQMGLEKNS